jgi:deoxyribonuclease (pyrimidine dimer)
MTRINTVPVSELSGKHLIAEHREIKRIPNAIRSGKAIVKNIPEQFTLGTGHVKFFYDKVLWLKNRYLELYQECLRRGYNVTSYVDSFDGINDDLMNDWQPTAASIELIRERIKERS